MTGRVTSAALIRHHLLSSPGGGVIVAFLVLLLAFLATAAPVALVRLGDATVQYRLATLSAVERDVVAEEPGAPAVPWEQLSAQPTTEEIWGGVTAAVEDVRGSASAPLPEILQPARTVVVGPEAALTDQPGTAEAALAVDPRYEEEISIVEGRLPEPAVFAASGPANDPASNIATVEIVLSAETASELEWSLGTARETQGFRGVLTLELVGIFEPVDADAAYWQHVPSVLEPNIFDDGNAPRVVTGTGFAHPASLAATLSGTRVATTTVWFPFDEGAVKAGDAEQVAAALRQLTAVSHPIADPDAGAGVSSVRFTADVAGAIDAALAQEAATAGVAAMIASGPIGVAAAVLVLGCRLVFERRRSSLRLLSARGASHVQLRMLLALDGLLAGLLPAIAGSAAAVALTVPAIGTVPAPGVILLAVAIGLLPPAVLAALAPAAAERRARTDLGAPGTRLRAILEAAVLALAALALGLLLLRGVGNGADALTAATPLLLALVACLVTLRLYPVPIHALLARARMSRTLGGFLGAARALREPAIGLVPVLALVVGVSVAVSSAVLLSSLQAGIVQSAGAQIGADLRVAGGLLTRDQLDRVRDVDGVAAATGISGAEPVTLEIGGEPEATSVFVVEAAELRDVQGDGPGMLPRGVSLEPDPRAMPVVVSRALANEIDGDAELQVGSLPARVVGVLDGPAPIGARASWLAIDSSYAAQVAGRDPGDRTLLIRLAGDADPDAVTAGVRDVVGPTLRLDSAAEIRQDIEASPAVSGMRVALALATGIAAVLGALAVAMTLTLAAAPRGRVLALLRTLGAPMRVGRILAAWEVGPPALAAVVAGTLFGAMVPLVVLAGVDLRPFTGSSAQPAYAVDPVILGVALAAFAVLVGGATVIALVISRRARAARVLRTVEEG